MGNDMEKWNHGYNNNHVVKIKGTFVDERNRKKVRFGDALVFIVMTGQCTECKMVPSVYQNRHVLIQDLSQWKYCWGWQEFTLFWGVYEVSSLQADAEQVEVQPAMVPCAWKKHQTLLFSRRRLVNTHSHPPTHENQ